MTWRRWMAPSAFAFALACSGRTVRAPHVDARGGGARDASAASPAPSVASSARSPSTVEDPPTGGRSLPPTVQPRPLDVETLAVYRDGRQLERVTVDEAAARGLVPVDLRTSFTPRVLAHDPALGELGRQPYHDTYVLLADDRVPDTPEFDRARRDRFLELYGIFPTLRVHRIRLADEARHACHASVEDSVLDEPEVDDLGPYVDLEASQRRARAYRAFSARLARARAEAGVARDEDLPDSRVVRVARQAVGQLRLEVEPIRALQEHLRCDGLLSSRAEPGVFDGYTVSALRVYQRRHMIVTNGRFDGPTRRTLATDSRELDFRSLLRTLRERVVDATGIVEDGSALGVAHEILGRILEPVPFQSLVIAPTLPDGAPDLVGEATEKAAIALGLTDPAAALEALGRMLDSEPEGEVVALELPAPPRYHGPTMELRVEIDRGDVWYDNPFVGGERRRFQPVEQRPRLVLYAKDGERWIPLVRYATTIGGWQKERRGGAVVMRYKNSDVGPRILRDVVASPAWLPPPTTPDDELMTRDPRRGWTARFDTIGPSYASAYGLAMMIHLREVPDSHGGPALLYDNGIREHGSANYASILRGYSHGCHRLFNHLALRLTSFVLAHRTHVRRGSIPAQYSRRVYGHGRSVRIRVETRGYFHELVPPLPVNVLEGRIRGVVRAPPPQGLGHRVTRIGDEAEGEGGADTGDAGE